MKPPPSFSQTTSTLRRTLSFIQIVMIRTSPRTKGKLTKLWTYLAPSENVLKASGPISGNSSSFPKVMLSPVKPSSTKHVAVSQWENRSNELNRSTLMPERPAEIRSRPTMK